MKKQSTHNRSQVMWRGEKNRPFQICRPCACGCDFRDGKLGVGYLTGSDAKGNGFSIWIQDEATYRRVAKLLEGKSNKTRSATK